MPIIVNVNDAITHTLLTQIQQDGEQSKLSLEYIAQALRQTNILLQQILEIETSNNGFLSQIEINTAPILQLFPFPQSFTVKETTMALTQPDPGATLQFTATPQPAGSSLGAVVPVWSSSDMSHVTITTDTTGLIATVVLGAAIPVGESVTLTVAATDPVGGGVATGTVTFTVGAPPPAFPTSFTIVQTA